MPHFPGRPDDTSPQAWEHFIELQRKMSPAEKIRAVFELTELAVRFTEAGVRRMYPAANEREIFLRVAARRLDRATMRKVYGWDPESDDNAAKRS